MEAIREKHQPKAVRGGRGPCLGEAVAFPENRTAGSVISRMSWLITYAHI